jgi:hypothetical protein
MPRPSAAAGGIGGLLAGLTMLAGVMTARSLTRSLFRWLTSDRPGRTPRVDPKAVEVGHETREVRPWVVILGGVLVVVGVTVAVGVATWFQAAKLDRPLALNPPPGLSTPAAPPPPPAPRLEEVPGEQLRQLRAAEDQILNGAAWVDRSAGIARIPIDRAEDLLLQQGVPARSAEEASQFRDATDTAPSGASSGRLPERRTP